jgi:hypothetical protein
MIEMLLPGQPDNFLVPHDLNPGCRSLNYPLAQNLARSTHEIIGTEPLGRDPYSGRSLRTKCGSRTGGWSLPGAMSD